MRPILSKDISILDFKDFYWLKKELQQFCREIGINATGSKIEISNRIEIFLKTGEILNIINSYATTFQTRKIKEKVEKMQPNPGIL